MLEILLKIHSKLPLWLSVLNCAALAVIAFLFLRILLRFSYNFYDYLCFKWFRKKELSDIISRPSRVHRSEDHQRRIRAFYYREYVMSHYTEALRFFGKVLLGYMVVIAVNAFFLKDKLGIIWKKLSGVLLSAPVLWLVMGIVLVAGVVIFTFPDKKARKFYGDVLWLILKIIYFPLFLPFFIIYWLRCMYSIFMIGTYTRRVKIRRRRRRNFWAFLVPIYKIGYYVLGIFILERLIPALWHFIKWAPFYAFGVGVALLGLLLVVMYTSIIWVPIAYIGSIFVEVGFEKWHVIALGIVAYFIVSGIIMMFADIGPSASSSRSSSSSSGSSNNLENAGDRSNYEKDNQYQSLHERDMMKLEEEYQALVQRYRNHGISRPWEHHRQSPILHSNSTILNDAIDDLKNHAHSLPWIK